MLHSALCSFLEANQECNAKQAVAWYKKRFWIEEMFRDLKNTLGLRKAHLKDENRLNRLLLGYQIAYLILSLVGFHVPKRWHQYFFSRPSLSVIWLALRTRAVPETKTSQGLAASYLPCPIARKWVDARVASG
jgi:transposase